MATSPLGPVPGIADSGFENSRPMSVGGCHTDGLIMAGPEKLSVSGPDAMVLTRTAKGLWVLSRTAAGAETYYVRTTLGAMLKTGEAFQYGGFGAGAQSSPPYPPKGIGILDAFLIAQVGVVALTSATLRIGTTVYSATLAPMQTDLVAATNLPSLATNANPMEYKLSVPVGSQVLQTADLSLVEVELAVTMAATGTLAIAGMGFHVAYNYN